MAPPNAGPGEKHLKRYLGANSLNVLAVHRETLANLNQCLSQGGQIRLKLGCELPLYRPLNPLGDFRSGSLHAFYLRYAVVA